MANELISVVIPMYNREDTILECINSVLNQTYRNIEVIVVDDCSSDKSVEIVNSITDPRVRQCIALEKNSGACFARNKGAENAKGKYIAFQDSDDYWLPNKLEDQFNYLLQGQYDMVFCGMERISTFGNYQHYFPIIDFQEDQDAQKQILFENRVSTQCILIEKEKFELVKFDESIKKFQDWDFAIRAAKILKLGYLKKSLVHSEVSENSISKNVSRIDALNVIYEKYKDLIVAEKKIDARFLKKMGDAYYDRKSKKCRTYYRQSLKRDFNIKVVAKLFISLTFGE